MPALTAEMMRLLVNDLMMYGLLMSAKLARVNDPSLVTKDPATMMPVGSSRNRARKAKNGTAPIHDRENRRPPEGRAAVVKATLLNSGSRQETACDQLA